MIEGLSLLLLTSHILGDFYFQPRRLAECKDRKIHRVLLHSLVYAVVSAVVASFFWNTKVFAFVFISAVMHLLIDIVKFAVCRLYNTPSGPVYALDQAAHVITILLLGGVFTLRGNSLNTPDAISQVMNIMGIDKTTLLKWALLLLIIGKPANVTFRRMFSHFKPVEDEIEDNRKTGAIIGTLERIIIVVFMSIGQYSAIGLVLTAKSIARYSRISKDREFGEYYLLGTLISLLFPVASFLLVF